MDLFGGSLPPIKSHQRDWDFTSSVYRAEMPGWRPPRRAIKSTGPGFFNQNDCGMMAMTAGSTQRANTAISPAQCRYLQQDVFADRAFGVG